MKIVLNWCSNP